MIAVALPGRWERRARSALGLGNDSAVLASSAQLRVPPGTPLGAIDERSLTRILVIIDPSVVNVSVAEEIAALQTVERTFAPVFLTSSLEGGGFRRFGYVWEYVRPHDPTLESHARWAERRQRRIVQTLEWYDTTVVVEVSEIDQVVAPDSLLRSLIRGFDPTRTD